MKTVSWYKISTYGLIKFYLVLSSLEEQLGMSIYLGRVFTGLVVIWLISSNTYGLIKFSSLEEQLGMSIYLGRVFTGLVVIWLISSNTVLGWAKPTLCGV